MKVLQSLMTFGKKYFETTKKTFLWFFTVTGLRNILGKVGVIALPYGWHILFFLIPFLLIFKISLSEQIVAAPPFGDLITYFDQGLVQLRLNFGNYLFLLEDRLYIDAYLHSIYMSGCATIGALLLAYPMAYGLTRMSGRARLICFLLIVLPFWTSFLVRIYAWMGLLDSMGLINTLLTSLGLIQEPLMLMHRDATVCLGIMYSYLPFMVLPLFVSLSKLDPKLLEAAYDLGCKPTKAFFTVTFPLSLKGALAGSMLVFIPGIGEFIIPELLGGPDTLMIGKVLWTEFFENRDWPLACALAVALLVFLVLPIVVFQRILSSETDRS